VVGVRGGGRARGRGGACHKGNRGSRFGWWVASSPLLTSCFLLNRGFLITFWIFTVTVESDIAPDG
jgi:hypothetical protein